MNLAFIDDQKSEIMPAIRGTEKLLIERGFRPQIDYFESGEEFLQAYHPDYYGIVFIDVFLNGISGPEIARRIREASPKSMLIFLTSDATSMAEVFALHAFDYIQKPYTEERVRQCLEDALLVLPAHLRMLTFTFQRQEVRLPFASIVAVASQAHHVDIVDDKGITYTPYSTFSSLADSLLEDTSFLLLNKGILVNMAHIRDFHDKCCELDNGMIFPVSSRKANTLEQNWHDYVFSKMIPRGRD